MTVRSCLVLALLLLVPMTVVPCAAQTIPSGRYFGQTPPGLTPEIFAPGIISLDDRYEYGIVFSPDLDECIFGITDSDWAVFNLMFTSMAPDSSWSDPVTAPFLGGVPDGLMAEYSPDGQKVFFASMRPSYPPSNIWVCDRNGGGWDAPVMIPFPVSSSSDEFAPSVTADGTLYFVSRRFGGFGSGDLYRSVPVAGEYTAIENLGMPLNSGSNEGSPLIDADETFMIFESNRPGGYGKSDLYISFRDGDSWTAPENLGPVLNTNQYEDDPFLSPDGKYLFFNRRAAYVTPIQTDLWWVDAGVLPALTSVKGHQLAAGAQGASLHQNQPNPFTPSTRISYTLPRESRVELVVYDVLGQRVRTLVSGREEAGTHEVECDLSRRAGVTSGTYYYRLEIEGEVVETRKMVLVR